ncbi:phosphoribosyltransferase-like protein [Obelidium mucronatum]|nr:phosphoribosyltransferase-like protein [Obelidium mucronatum]
MNSIITSIWAAPKNRINIQAFHDRTEAGDHLANLLLESQIPTGEYSPIVVATSGGGVLVAASVTKAFNVPLNMLDIHHGTKYWGQSSALDVKERTVFLVDDGITTGSTMRTAIKIIKSMGPAYLVVAAPVGIPSSCDNIAKLVNLLFVPVQPQKGRDVALWYDDFPRIEKKRS